MALVVRLILALMLVVQSLPGSAVERCAMTTGTPWSETAAAATDDEPVCACCATDTAGCASGDTSPVCNCGMPQPEEPKSPPGDSKSERAQMFAAIVPTVIGVVALNPVHTPRQRSLLNAAPRRSTNSIQSVLCVWVV